MALTKRDKFIFNPDTLSYEKVVSSTQARIINFIAYVVFALIFSLLMSYLYYTYASGSKDSFLFSNAEKSQYFLNDQMWLYIIGAVIILIVVGSIFLFFYFNRTQKEIVNKINSLQEDYILLDLPDKYRGLFQDMLRGFEDYCAIKGYQIKISIDNTFTDKIAFKINLNEASNVSEKELRKDYREFTEKLRKGEKFENLNAEHPREFQHILQLQNRINLLENDNRNLGQMLKWQEKFAEKLTDPGFKLQPTQGSPIYIQVGDNGSITASQQTVTDGTLVVGDGNDFSNKITISNSFNSRKEQIDNINSLLNLLKDEVMTNHNNAEKLDELVTCLYQIKGSLANDDSPNPNKLASWLYTIKSISEKLVLIHDTKEAIEWVLKSFGVIP